MKLFDKLFTFFLKIKMKRDLKRYERKLEKRLRNDKPWFSS